ncbi:MAG: tRNA threonylcarbamoyladenosine dehydratase [Bacteroidales bacterium]|nr:tRNA threonylcarbamoyladenosine dehydratase [Bacteroidales bacterium]
MLDFKNWQERTKLLVGDNYKKFADAHVLVVGLGGVGGIAAEMICRAGVGRLTIVDSDTICETNLNRQIYTLTSNIGKSKAEILGEKLKSINPKLELKVINLYVNQVIVQEILTSDKFNYIVDAIDTLSPKVQLLFHSVKLGLKVVSSMGAGGKLDPTMVSVADISQTHDCPLARILRKRLHRLGVYEGVKAIFSPEKIIDGSVKLVESENKKTTLGTISYLPSIFGIYASWVVLNDLMNY